ncbi:MAG: hypothetical protein ACPG49_12935 [Chitinophagales bacterium]
MKPIQFYKSAFFVMLLLNIGTLLFIASGPHHPPPNHREANQHGFLQRAIDILGLEAEQEKSFKESATKHNTATKALEARQEKAAKGYFHTILEADNVLEDSLLLQLQQLEKDKIVLTYQHFEDVKALLKPSQQANFSNFLERALQILIINSKNNSPPPKDF